MRSDTMAEDDIYTQDGTMNIYGKPANKKKTGKWKACWFILGNECVERLAFYGMCTNLVNYLQGRFNQGNAAAANNVTTWSGTCFVTPLIGAFIADAYLGRYWTITIFSIIYAIGMILLTLSTSVPGLTPSCDANGCHPTSAQTAASFVPLYLVALGAGAIKPCVSSFGADQFDQTDKKESKNISPFFNWFYLSINVGQFVASTLVVWIQINVGWEWGFGVPAVAKVIAIIFFFGGSRLYRLQIPGGSPFTRICQVIVAASRKSNLQIPADKSLLHESIDVEPNIKGSCKLDHTNNFKCLDKAAIVTESDMKDLLNPWRLCTVTQVEELKSIIRLLPVWASLVLVPTIYNQMSTVFILQGNTMNQHISPLFKIPSASLSLFNTLGCIFWVPMYDLIIVPCARRFTGHAQGFEPLQRIGIGLIILSISMAIAGILENFRLDIVRKNNYYDLETIPMSILWLIPQYFIIGCAEVFISIGQMEFFYGQMPDAMRSLGAAFSLTTTALGSYTSTLLVTIVNKVTTTHGRLGWIPNNLNRGHLDYFFWLLSFLCFLDFLVFLWVAKGYQYKKVAAI